MRPLGQPQVVGEMITGVLLGPSLFGLLLPDLQARLFPKPTLTVIYCLAQIGLALYMFLVGLEFDVGLIRNRMKSAHVGLLGRHPRPVPPRAAAWPGCCATASRCSRRT